MPIPVPSIEKVKQNYKEATASALAQRKYKENVFNPKRPWKEAALAASELQKQAMTDALSRDAVRKGIEKVAADKQKNRASTLGPSRFSTGAAAGLEEFGSEMSKVLSTIAAVELSPRGPKGSPDNYKRSESVGAALHAAKIA